MKLILIIICSIIMILFIILLIPLKIRVIRNNNYNDIDLYIITKDIRIDIDRLFKSLIDNTNPKTTINDIKRLYNSQNIIKSIFKLSKVVKLTIVLYPHIIINNIYVDYMSFMITNYLYHYIDSTFKKVESSYISTSLETLNTSKCINIEIVLKIKLIYFLIAVFSNYSDFKKVVLGGKDAKQ